MISPTQRSLAALKKQGWTCGIVERFNPHVGPHGIRQDFCGGIDVIAFRQYEQLGTIRTGRGRSYGDEMVDKPVLLGRPYTRHVGILGIQCCAASGLAAHRTKLLAEPRMREWVAAGARLVLHSWAKRGDRGKRKLWTCREEELRLEDFEQREVVQSGSTPAS